MKLNYGTLVVGFLVYAILIYSTWAQPWTPAKTVGILIAVPSSLLLVLARVQLGAAFSVKAEASTLVTTGLFSHIRNPIYIFSGLMIAGIMLWVNKPWLLLLFAVIIPMQIVRSRKEEQVLTERFGDAYLAYKRKTRF